MPQENEAGRLAKLYAAMSDGELEKVAEESAELTAEARKALRAEIARRKMNIAVAEPPAEKSVEPEWQEWSMVRRFRDLPEAILARGSLESSGVECMLEDDNMVRLDWFISNAIGGVRLVVKPEDLEIANEILDQPIPEDFDYSDSENFEQPKCPKCGSLDITFETLNKPVAYGSAWLGFPIPMKSEKWICNTCNARWVEEKDPEDDPQKTPPTSDKSS
jgi:hypothetical protein